MNPDVFQEPQTRRILAYVAENYGDEAEFLWEKSPKTCIFRNSRSRKWYAALFRLNGKKIGLESEREVEILNLRFEKGLAREFARENPAIFPGYHMNKENWITVLLDDSLQDEMVFELLDQSYRIVSRASERD